MIEELKKTFDTFNKKMSVWDIQKNKREENFKKFVETGLPTKKLEDWKFSNFNQIISNNFKHLNIDLDEWMDLETRIPELNKKLKEYFCDRANMYNVKEIIVSGSDERGEGEHHTWQRCRGSQGVGEADGRIRDRVPDCHQ